MTQPKVEPTRKTSRKQGYLYCNRCGSTVPYHAMGDPEVDMPFPQHRCGRDIRPFDGWSLQRPGIRP